MFKIDLQGGPEPEFPGYDLLNFLRGQMRHVVLAGIKNIL